MPEPGEIISGKYRIIERLGSGAMGIVDAALHLDTDKHVALKWLNPEISRLPDSQERFKREAKATGRIHHPNVVAVHDCGDHDGQLYLVMEYLAGPTLRAKLTAATDGRFALTEALALLFPVMRGISAAHAVGVLHRDLKPENVLLSESPDGLAPIPKVLDFGLAKVRSEAASFAAKLSMPGSVLGTYQYMAPEQLRPEVEVDERIDVYALGAMLYEMLSGKPPYHADNPVDLVLQIHAGEVPALDGLVPDLPVELSAVLACALARDREQRFANVDALALALEPFTDLSFRGERHVKTERPPADAPCIATAPSARRALPRTASRQERWWGVGLGFLALFAEPTAGLAVSISGSQPGPQRTPSNPSQRSAATTTAPPASATETTHVASPPIDARPVQHHTSNDDWFDEGNAAAEAPQPQAAAPTRAPTKGMSPMAAPSAAAPLPSRAVGVDLRPVPAAARSTPAPSHPSHPSQPVHPGKSGQPVQLGHQGGAGPLGVNEF